MSNPIETFAVRLYQHLPKKLDQWTEEMIHKNFRLEKISLPPLQRGQVLVKMEKAPINPVDLLIARNLYAKEQCNRPFPQLLGSEGCGTVVDQASDVTGLTGRRVAILRQHAWAEYCVTSANLCLPLPDEVSWELGASAWINPGTAFGMITLAKERGLNCIIFTAAASALGKMVIKYGKTQGVDVIAVVRRDQQVKECKEIGAIEALNINDKDFDEKLKQIACDKKATLTYDAIGGDTTGRILSDMPFGSEIKVFGFLSADKVGGFDFVDLLSENKKLSGYWLADHLKDANFAKSLIAEVPKLLHGPFNTSFAKVFALEDIHQAILENARGTSGGKTLIDLSTSRQRRTSFT